jgi:hypothetical protein
MHASLEPIMAQIRILLPIIKNESKVVYEVMRETQLHPYFCLSWIITWFSHDLYDFEKVCRLFDFFISSNPILPIYLSAAVSCKGFYCSFFPSHLNFAVMELNP